MFRDWIRLINRPLLRSLIVGIFSYRIQLTLKIILWLDNFFLLLSTWPHKLKPHKYFPLHFYQENYFSVHNDLLFKKFKNGHFPKLSNHFVNCFICKSKYFLLISLLFERGSVCYNCFGCFVKISFQMVILIHFFTPF